MTKLKTLKDIEDPNFPFGIEDENRLIPMLEVKEKAIKWVKDARNKDPKNWYIRCEIMIIFHNITEEDLK